MSPLENAFAGLQSQDKVHWDEELLSYFRKRQAALESHKSITLPQPDDQIWIVTDASVTRYGIGSTLYITRDGKLWLAGFFSAKIRKQQVNWLPCEVEALCISASVKHFSPYIIQSKYQACLLTYIFAQFISQISTFRLIKTFFKRVKFFQCYTIFSSILTTILYTDVMHNICI